MASHFFFLRVSRSSVLGLPIIHRRVSPGTHPPLSLSPLFTDHPLANTSVLAFASLFPKFFQTGETVGPRERGERFVGSFQRSLG